MPHSRSSPSCPPGGHFCLFDAAYSMSENDCSSDHERKNINVQQKKDKEERRVSEDDNYEKKG